MRESNFAFPAQNRACVCISSQLYDRRALDTTSPLPLLNSLTHLTYLTSTSPRIREIMTMDGGLERLVRILHDFCMCPPPPENPAVIYGLSPSNTSPPKLVPTLNPQTFDKHAAYRFSLAFQCIVNIGVRGSEPIRSRVVQAGTLDVVGCILEAWLAHKGFAVGPSSSATGLPRETREQRMARRLAMADQQRQREEAAELSRALQRQIRTEHNEELGGLSSESVSGTEADTSTDTSTTATPVRSTTPTGTVFVQSRDRTGTIIGHPIWDEPPRNQRRQLAGVSPSRPDTETEDDADGDVDMDRSRGTNDIPPARSRHHTLRRRTVVGIISDAPPQPTIDTDAHIIINDARGGVVGGDGGVALAGAGGVEEGIVSLEANDDFAMGAPPGAPGAIGLDEGTEDTEPGRPAPDITPRATTINLPLATQVPGVERTGHPSADGTAAAGVPRGAHRTRATRENTIMPPPSRAALAAGQHHVRDSDSGTYRDEDVLFSLQLLAYLSKYPHVRQAFYKSRTTFHPASAHLHNPRAGQQGLAGPSRASNAPAPAKDQQHGLFSVFGGSRGKEKEKSQYLSTSSAASAAHPSSPTPRYTNVFSLVERFTFRPSSSESNLQNPPPSLPPEIQYWAGVIMRNACRKDESRGGIRQCANMLCGKWETYPREFAKCRRCRKAKYCGKECQSTAWSEGHRFWCSAKETEADGDGEEASNATAGAEEGAASNNAASTGGSEGRPERTERERHVQRQRSVASLATGVREPPLRPSLALGRAANRLDTTGIATRRPDQDRTPSLLREPIQATGTTTITGRQNAFLRPLPDFGVLRRPDDRLAGADGDPIQSQTGRPPMGRDGRNETADFGLGAIEAPREMRAGRSIRPAGAPFIPVGLGN